MNLRNAVLAPLLLACACADVGHFVWVDDYVTPTGSSRGAYVIAPGDIINVRVFNQDAMSARVRVRPDGKVSLPFLSDVAVGGRQPTQVATELESRLREYIKQPVVTISLEEPAKLSIAVIGEVAHPGPFPLDVGSGVLQALAAAGGLTEFAHKDRIFVLRKAPAVARIRFTFEKLAHAEGGAALFQLRDGDTVVVE